MTRHLPCRCRTRDGGQTTRPTVVVCLLVLGILGPTGTLCAELIPTSDFLDLYEGHFAGWPNGVPAQMPPLVIEDVTFSFTPSGLSDQHIVGSAPSFIAGSQSDPAEPHYFGPPLSGPPPTIIDFSEPLAAFGVTFYRYGGVLEIFDGPGATGQLLGSVIGKPSPPPWSTTERPVDFVALTSSQRALRSARVYGFGDPSSYYIVGLGFSLKPPSSTVAIPEPTGGQLTILGVMLGVAAVGWRKYRATVWQRR